MSLTATTSNAAPLSLEQQRAIYLKAKQAYTDKKVQLADQLTIRIKNYPLHPYLELLQIQRDINSISQNKIDAFTHTYKQTPLAKKAQASYLQKLANKKQWKQFLINYKRLPLTSSYYKCYQLQAKINTGQGASVLTEAEKLWNVGKSQPGSCDRVFSYWMKHNNPSSNIAFERSWKAINNKNYKIAKFAQKHVTKKSQVNSLNLFWKIQKDISLISKSTTVSKNTLHNADIAAYAIRKLGVKQTDLALKTWLRDRTRFNFSKDQRTYLNTYFGNKYAKSTYYNPAAQGILQKIDPLFKYDEVSEWKTRLALISQNWPLAVQLIGKMPEGLQQKNRWRYWFETAKQRANPKKYKAKYHRLSRDRDFYSFIAAELSGTPLQLNDTKTSIPTKVTSKLLQTPSVRRMSELVKTGDTAKAYREWQILREQLSDQQKLAIAYIVADWGWYIQGIRIAAKLKSWNELEIRFPRSQNKLFAQLGTAKGIGSTWPVAIARQESAYNQYARSPAGARGFMQLMPATAKMTAKKFNIKYTHKDDLYDPKTNISLGTAYLGEMMQRFNNKAHSTAAYNAGPHRVDRWLKSRGTLPLDIWIETIPFDETRKYVQNVLTYSAIYDLLAGRKAQMLSPKDRRKLTVNQS
ncbi:MAG: transglycosylase SLT domain-containing protein [Oceanospirillaceae bacterium]|nr:transglycosylase SLT domain-containing protein [Oceanospirillaceae bacterium]